MDEICQFYPESYSSPIKATHIRARLSATEIKSALAKIYTKNDSNKIILEKNNMAVIGGEKRIHYRKTTAWTDSDVPWYSISKNKLKELGETEICCLFFKPVGSNYELYYKKWQVDEIMDQDENPIEPWTYEVGRELYRWNPQGNYVEDDYDYKMTLFRSNKEKNKGSMVKQIMREDNTKK